MDNDNKISKSQAKSVATEVDRTMVEAMKQRLTDYRSLNRDIENNIERLERLEDKMYGVSSPNLTGMPRNPSPIRDKFADMLGRKDELEQKIRELIAKRDQERKAIEEMVQTLRNPDERAVINMRYLDCADWDEIIEMLYGFRCDFDDGIENYKQRTFRLHSSAISKLAQAIAVG